MQDLADRTPSATPPPSIYSLDQDLGLSLSAQPHPTHHRSPSPANSDGKSHHEPATEPPPSAPPPRASASPPPLPPLLPLVGHDEESHESTGSRSGGASPRPAPSVSAGATHEAIVRSAVQSPPTLLERLQLNRVRGRRSRVAQEESPASFVRATPDGAISPAHPFAVPSDEDADADADDDSLANTPRSVGRKAPLLSSAQPPRLSISNRRRSSSTSVALSLNEASFSLGTSARPETPSVSKREYSLNGGERTLVSSSEAPPSRSIISAGSLMARQLSEPVLGIHAPVQRISHSSSTPQALTHSRRSSASVHWSKLHHAVDAIDAAKRSAGIRKPRSVVESHSSSADAAASADPDVADAYDVPPNLMRQRSWSTTVPSVKSLQRALHLPQVEKDVPPPVAPDNMSQSGQLSPDLTSRLFSTKDIKHVGDDDDGSADEDVPEQDDHGVIAPNARWLLAWHALLLMFILYNAVVIPYRLTFGFTSRGLGVAFSFDIIGDVMFLVDIFLNFRKGYFFHGLPVTDRSLIRKRYVRSWLAVDVIASIPFDLVQLIEGRLLSWVRLPKLLRMLRVLTLVSQLEREQGVGMPLVKLIKLTLYIFLVVHYSACGYFGFSVAEGSDPSRWVISDEAKAKGWFFVYLRCLLWSLGLMGGTADGEIPTTGLEYSYQLLIMISGVYILAYLVGSIGSVVDAANERSRAFDQRVEYISRFLESIQVPHKLQTQVKRYFDFLWSQNKGFPAPSFLTQLPDSLRADLMSEMTLGILERVELFENLDPGFVPSLVIKLVPTIVVPDEIVVYHGDIGRTLYFVQVGRLGVELPCSTRVVNTLGKGDTFGEFATLLNKRRTATVFAIEHCQLFVLNKSDVDDVLAAFPRSSKELTARTSALYVRTMRSDRTFTEGVLKEQGRPLVQQQQESLGPGGTAERQLSMLREEDPDRSSIEASPPQAVRSALVGPATTTASLFLQRVASGSTTSVSAEQANRPTTRLGDDLRPPPSNNSASAGSSAGAVSVDPSPDQSAASAAESDDMDVSPRVSRLVTPGLDPEEQQRQQISRFMTMTARNTITRAESMSSTYFRRSVSGVADKSDEAPVAKVAVIEPATPFRRAWIAVLAIVSLYNVWSVPFRIAFGKDTMATSWIALDVIFDVFLACDLLLNFRTAVIVEGHLVSDPARIRSLYLHGAFWLDLVAVLPIDIAWLFVGPTHWLRLNKVLKLYTFYSIFGEWIYSATRTSLLSLLQLMTTIFLSTHVFACGYYLFTHYDGFGEFEGTPTNPFAVPPWLPEEEVADYDSSVQYARSLYYSLSVLTGTGQDILPETSSQMVYTLVVMVVGQIVIAYLIGNLSSLISNLDHLAVNFERERSEMNDYIKLNKISSHLGDRVRRFMDHQWAVQHGADTNRALEDLPIALRVMILDHMYGAMIRSMPLFARLDQRSIGRLLSRLRVEHFPQGEAIFRQGERGDKMYIIVAGYVSIEIELAAGAQPNARRVPLRRISRRHTRTGRRTSESSRYQSLHHKSIGTGSLFGEASLFANNGPAAVGRRSASAIAEQSCVLLSLTREDFDEVLEASPWLEQHLRKVARRRLAAVATVSHSRAASAPAPAPEVEGGDSDSEPSSGSGGFEVPVSAPQQGEVEMMPPI